MSQWTRNAWAAGAFTFVQVFILWSLNAIATTLEFPFAGQANDLDPLASAPRAYLLAMIGGVVHGMLYTWAERGFQDSPAVLAAIMDSALSEGIEKILLTQTKR